MLFDNLITLSCQKKNFHGGRVFLKTSPTLLLGEFWNSFNFQHTQDISLRRFFQVALYKQIVKENIFGQDLEKGSTKTIAVKKQHCTLPETNIAPETLGLVQMSFLLEMPPARCYVSF